MKIKDLKLFQYSLPLTSHLSIKKRLIQNRKGLIVELIDGHDNSYYGDACPLPGFSPDSLTQTIKEMRRLKKLLLNTLWSEKILLSQYNIISENLDDTKFPALTFALESVILSALNKGELKSENIAVNSLLFGSKNELLEKAHYLKNAKAVKIKVSRFSIDDAIEIVKEVKRLNPKASIRIDPNRSWTLVKAIHFASAFEEKEIEYIEEPLKNPHDLLCFSHISSHPLGFDESLLDLPIDFLMQIQSKRAFIIKPALLGRLRSIEKLVEKAKRFNLTITLSSIFESGVGISSIIALANYFNITSPMGIDSYSYLKEDLLKTPLRIEAGRVLNTSNKPILNSETLQKV